MYKTGSSIECGPGSRSCVHLVNNSAYLISAFPFLESTKPLDPISIHISERIECGRGRFYDIIMKRELPWVLESLDYSSASTTKYFCDLRKSISYMLRPQWHHCRPRDWIREPVKSFSCLAFCVAFFPIANWIVWGQKKQFLKYWIVA